ncbi:MAG: hypothetical protein JNK57_11580 [Planctomycetaceae bacterium]|nr:hypothetical protein [Planctomycetaceae bacterium]
MLRSIQVFVLLFAISLGASQTSAGLVTYNMLDSPSQSPDAQATGDFVGNVDLFSTNINGGGGNFNSGGRWGLWSNGAQSSSQSESFSSLSGIGRSLNQTGDFFRINFRNQSIANGGSVGVYLLNSSNQVMTTMYFSGGGTHYQINDGGGNSSTGFGYSTNAFELGFELSNSSGGYSLTIGSQTLSRSFANFGSGISSFVVFNNNANVGGDVTFNNVRLNAVPEPTSGLLIGLFGLIAGVRRYRHTT